MITISRKPAIRRFYLAQSFPSTVHLQLKYRGYKGKTPHQNDDEILMVKKDYCLFSLIIIFKPLQQRAVDGLKILKPWCFRNKAFSL